MKIKLLRSLLAITLLLTPLVNFGQAPTLGSAANFVLFTTAGAVTNSGTPHLTHLTGNVGTNSGSSTGFGNVDGVMHDGDAASIQCAADLLTAYTQLNAAIPTFFPAPLLGNNDTLLPGVNRIATAATLNGNMVLDAQGDPNAVFIFQIQGSFTANASAKVKLINGAAARNIYWKVEGMISLATGTTMRGTMVAHNAAISMSANDTLEGRALSIAGAVTTNSILAYTPLGGTTPVLNGPAAPTMTATAAYGILSGIGPVTNTGITHVGGDVGTNSGLTSGFDPLLVSGTIHTNPDVSTAAAAADLGVVFNYLNTLTADIQLLYPSDFGYDLSLTPHTYHLGAATSFAGNLYLNAEGNPNAVFVIQIDGALSTSTFARVILQNGALAKNVYWKVSGAVNINNNTLFNGNIVAAGAITSSPGDTLSGKFFTTNGAIAVNGSSVNVTTPACTAAPITGANQVCSGTSTALSDADGAGVWSSSNAAVATVNVTTGVVTGLTAGTTTITYTSAAACESTMPLTVNTSPQPITGPGNVCVGNTITLADLTPGGTWSSSNNAQATVNNGGMVTGVANGLPVITYTAAGNCRAVKTVTVGPYAGGITGPSNVCVGSTISLTDSIGSGSWTSSNAHATVSNGLVTGVSAGLATISLFVSNSCGFSVATKTIQIDTAPDAGTITGPSTVCTGSTITLSDNQTGGTWASTNNNATVANGVVTGVFPGIDTITYSVTNGCGTAAATHTVTVNPLPDEGSISGPSAVCTGSSIILSDGSAGGTWSASNTTASVINGVVTGAASGIDTISYTVTNGCGSATAIKTIMIDTPGAGNITGPTQVCVNGLIQLTDTTPGGIWSASNTNAGVVNGLVNGMQPGLDTISYTLLNTCGVSTTSAIITVNPLPDAGVISGPSSVCTGSIIILTETVTGGTWNSSNTATSVANGIVTGITAGTDTIQYAVANTCGTDTAIAIITVNPTPDAGTITGASSVCVGSSITLTDTEPNGFYTSSNSSAVVAGGGLVIGIAPGTDTITYSVSNANCSATTSKIITVNALPDAGSIAGASSVCIGSSIQLTNTATGGTWSSSNTNATVVNGLVSGINPGMDTIRYIAITSCGSDTATKNIVISQTPATPIISTKAPTTVCLGTMYQNFGTATAPATGVNYSWTAVNAVVWAQGTQHENALINFNEPGNVYITLHATIAGSTCASEATTTVTVGTSVANTPTVSYFFDHFVCTPSNEGSYQWGYDDKLSLDSTILTGEINQDYLNANPDNDKSYWVMTSASECAQKTYYRNPTAVQLVNSEIKIAVYPNPANSQLNVTLTNVSGAIQIAVLNMTGQTVSNTESSDGKAVINVAALPAGSYLVSCYKDGVKISTARFIKN